MKKFLLTVMAILTIASASSFAMYGDRDDWIDFLTDGNQFRARMDQLGFVLGNNTIKGTLGVRSQALKTSWGSIMSGETDNVGLNATISAGIGYTSEPFSIGLGYNFTYYNSTLGAHTPVLTINALNNNLRIAIPIQVGVSKNPFGKGNENQYKDYLGISTDTQIRYYTGIDVFNAIRIYFKYGQSGYKNAANNSDMFLQSVGFEARFYFLNTVIGNATINPYVKIAYNTALIGSNTMVRAVEPIADSVYVQKNTKWDKNPYNVTAAAVLGITANSDIVSLYVEPSLGYRAEYAGKAQNAADQKVKHGLAWGAYAELYITPVEDLEWYFEMDVNNSGTKQASRIPVYFEATTGITWYLPEFN
ncbi:cell surface protein [Brachyspira hampsonii]|uniref:Cell surface protein n=1 Tax=Brachyspira hampsonii TaxID=1287055 RepID=A0A1E5NFI4_9SPIR|nr:variable surface family protein [Brachyspira hampsonii]OEJ14903.1 cell surface protein [Brachyspira hampsonii]